MVPAARPFEATAEEKAQWVKRFLESGLSIRKFSAQNGIGYMSLWRWTNIARAKQTPDGAVGVYPVVPAFTEIKLLAPVESSVWVAELSLPNGKVLRLSKDVPAALLEQLLRLC